VLAVEFKINLLAPANSPWLLARGEVLRPGSTLTTCFADVWGVERETGEIPADAVRIATMLSTIITRPVRA
jgi:acyl-coenzyme A thioesterase PaaI-like protein